MDPRSKQRGIINKYTIIKASPSDLGLQDNKNIFPSHIPDFINLPSCSQEGAQAKSIRPQEGAQPKSIMSQEKYQRNAAQFSKSKIMQHFPGAIHPTRHRRPLLV